MPGSKNKNWKSKIVSPEKVLSKIRPGMSIFLGTAVAEPRTLVKSLMASEANNLQDLELIQLVSLGDAISIGDKYANKFRLKTFFAGWVASEAIKAGRVDLIPCRFSRVPSLIESGTIGIDAAFVQITPPDEAGYASLGVAVDVARQAMAKASLVVGEINAQVPRTFGDTFVHVDDFDFLVEATTPPFYFPRWPVTEVYDKIGANVASLIQDGSCLPFSIGPLYEALARHLVRKSNLGIHSPFFTDALMDLVKSGAVTNRRKSIFKGKSVAAHALGSAELMRWLDNNPLVEFQGVDVVADPKRIASIDRFVVTLPGRKVDFTGGIVLHSGKGNVGTQPGEAQEFFSGAWLSNGGKTILALPSRNLLGESNIVPSVRDYPNQFSARESLDIVVTEYGTAPLAGRTIRERALALIDIAHPDDRAELVRLAKKDHILYPDQTYLSESGKMYPEELATTQTFDGNLVLRFRAIRPSDVEQMRRLFYRFSDNAVYYRYFSPIKTMPHAKMQEYVNVDYRKTMSIVGLIGEPGEGTIIAEARYVRLPDRPYADVAFVVDEAFQGKGIATYLFQMLINIARNRGIEGFKADVLASNKAMIKVFEKSPFPLKAVLDSGVYELIIPFHGEKEEP
ncbi:bifunctional acetyl-CoA hydrolase/transferase family protein/GNAT family N-acetyltransferase [Desulfatiglans anilini]|uniref:bifunctional acetyl-CoA hydrolase/transferase family protein/GNAT family N-acetyltransferase n=1 Tax=Desulfatiglans anilini TaxID=90728 RepID=UPI0004208C2C|nr:bifunctional acetyl-CoA hydrolase/transferase family protein/GNAT family N-acetyltransferase [Desulfatiglans anilini]